VITAWDLGMKDLTTIWFAQKIGQEIHFIDFYQSSGKGLDHYARVLQEKGYLYGFHLLPHDIKIPGARHRAVASRRSCRSGSSRSSSRSQPADGIAGVRSIIPIAGSTRSAASSVSTRSGPTTCNYPPGRYGPGSAGPHLGEPCRRCDALLRHGPAPDHGLGARRLQAQRQGDRLMPIGAILLIVLVLLLVGALPRGPAAPFTFTGRVFDVGAIARAGATARPIVGGVILVLGVLILVVEIIGEAHISCKPCLGRSDRL
jgi:hypothetical protein